MVIILILCLSLLCAGSTQCGRFAREELGTSDMVRFTSGLHKYYNCTIVGSRLTSNLKIGVYIHDHKTKIQFDINDTNTYRVSTVRIEDFYFAYIDVTNTITGKNKYIKLIAKDRKMMEFLDSTVLRILITETISSAPTFKNSSVTIITLFDDLFIGSIVGKLSVQKEIAQVIFSMDPSYLTLIKEFSITTDGRILLTRRLNEKKKNAYEFKVNTRYMGSSLQNSIMMKISVKPGIRKKVHFDQSLRNRYLHPVKAPAYSRQEQLYLHYNISFLEFAPKIYHYR